MCLVSVSQTMNALEIRVWWPCTWSFSRPAGLGHFGISVSFWLLTTAHFQDTKFSLVGNFPVPSPPPSLSCGVQRSLVCMKEGKSPQAFIHPLGPGTFTPSGAAVSQKKTFVVAQGW